MAQFVTAERFECLERNVANSHINVMAEAETSAKILKSSLVRPDRKIKRSLSFSGLPDIIAPQPTQIREPINPNKTSPNQFNALAAPRFNVSILPPASIVNGINNGRA